MIFRGAVVYAHLFFYLLDIFAKVFYSCSIEFAQFDKQTSSIS